MPVFDLLTIATVCFMFLRYPIATYLLFLENPVKFLLKFIWFLTINLMGFFLIILWVLIADSMIAPCLEKQLGL